MNTLTFTSPPANSSSRANTTPYIRCLQLFEGDKFGFSVDFNFRKRLKICVVVHVRTGSEQLHSSRVVSSKVIFSEVAETQSMPQHVEVEAATPLQLVVDM